MQHVGHFRHDIVASSTSNAPRLLAQSMTTSSGLIDTSERSPKQAPRPQSHDSLTTSWQPAASLRLSASQVLIWRRLLFPAASVAGGGIEIHAMSLFA